jgi:geranylgeranyl pyrophosphate synthase
MQYFDIQRAAYIERIETGIDLMLPEEEARPSIIHEAMRYSMQAGGKRLRPTLALAAADMAGASQDALPAAIAVECLHAYSLIHDDLPCVDNSELRRGRPTSHVRFGEAVALLAGDALLTEAFRTIGIAYANKPRLGMALVGVLSNAASSQCLIGGQVEDILGEQHDISPPDLDFIHLNKTAALISASLEMGLLHAGPKQKELETIRRAGRALGLAFQIVDDVLDATVDATTLGKSAGSDAALGKNTYVKFYGVEASRKRATELCEEAAQALLTWGEGSAFLVALARETALRLK